MDRIDWIPVDILADIIVELANIDGTEADARTKAPQTIQVYHAVNPEDVGWDSLLPTVIKHLGSSYKVVTWGEWVDALRRSQENASLAELKQNPGLKLLRFFESLTLDESQSSLEFVLDVEMSAANSRTLASLEPVNPDWFNLWMNQWGY